jgi:nitrogen fixation protein FixH
MTTPSADRVPFVIKGWHVAAGVSAFFAVVIGVDASFAVLAYRSHPGQVAVRPYEDGLVYNAELARMQAQQALGWSASAGAAPGTVVVQMRDRQGAPLTGLKLTALLQRPATERGRVTVPLAETAPGRYATAPATLTGTWDVHVEARRDARMVFAADRRLTWP